MTGWPAVAATTGLLVIALIGLNVRLYRRLRAARAQAEAQARDRGDAGGGGGQGQL